MRHSTRWCFDKSHFNVALLFAFSFHRLVLKKETKKEKEKCKEKKKEEKGKHCRKVQNNTTKKKKYTTLVTFTNRLTRPIHSLPLSSLPVVRSTGAATTSRRLTYK